MRVDEKMVCIVCDCIEKLATDPSGFSLITNELAMSDEQLSGLQAVPLTQFSRAERMQVWESCLAATAGGMLRGDHGRPPTSQAGGGAPAGSCPALDYRGLCAVAECPTIMNDVMDTSAGTFH